MLIPSIYCITGSCIHEDKRNAASRLKKNIFIIIGVFAADAVTALVISTIALLGFLSIPGVTINISFTAKIIMVAGGTLVFVVDSCYLIYRVIKASGESNKIFKKDYKEIMDKINARITKIDKKLLVFQECARILESAIDITTKELETQKKPLNHKTMITF